jgi:hypothetical protein
MMMKWARVVWAGVAVVLLGTATSAGAARHMVSLGVSGGGCPGTNAAVYATDEWFANRRVSEPLEENAFQIKILALRVQNDCEGYSEVNRLRKDGSVVHIIVDPHTTAFLGQEALEPFGLYRIGDYGSGGGCCATSPSEFQFVIDAEVLPRGEMVRTPEAERLWV